MIPNGSGRRIKQEFVNLFCTGNWKGLSEAEASTRPKPETLPALVPCFAEPAERASWTLHDAFSKDLHLGVLLLQKLSQKLVFVDCRYVGLGTAGVFYFQVPSSTLVLGLLMKVLLFLMDGMSDWFWRVRLMDLQVSHSLLY